jgi:hypothetical protein
MEVNTYTLLFKSPSEMDVEEIKRVINQLLYDAETQKRIGATDRENLNIVILRDKAHYLNFLQGFTKWNSIGTWREFLPTGEVVEYPEEKNISVEIQFKDRPDELVGNRLMDLFSEYNKRVIGEKLLYAYTQPVEESTL